MIQCKTDVIFPSGVTAIVITGYEDKEFWPSCIPSDLREQLLRYYTQEEFNWKAGESCTCSIQHEQRWIQIFSIGLGKWDDVQMETIRKAIGSVTKSLCRSKSKIAAICLPLMPDTWSYYDKGRLMGEACYLAEYKFSTYKTDAKPINLQDITFVCEIDNSQITDGVEEGKILAESTIFAREMVNEPANVLTPAALAKAAVNASKDFGFHTQVLGLSEIQRLNMHSFLAVSQGSDLEPKLIVMRYQGDPANPEKIFGLVGKGLTYDSGGYCLKPPLSMVNMKNDMGGAAAVMGAIVAAARNHLKLNITAVVAACENMISGHAYHTGDIIRTMAGKTIEVVNTDAEGRLTLVDAIHYSITKEEVSCLVDIATLTGAVFAALGSVASGVVTNSDSFYRELQHASTVAGEKVWQLPTFPEFKEQLKSEIADLKNVGGPGAGTITAGLFIQEFVQDVYWLHIDIAGTAYAEKENAYHSFGATGVGVRLLYQLLKNVSIQPDRFPGGSSF